MSDGEVREAFQAQFRCDRVLVVLDMLEEADKEICELSIATGKLEGIQAHNLEERLARHSLCHIFTEALLVCNGLYLLPDVTFGLEDIIVLV